MSQIILPILILGLAASFSPVIIATSSGIVARPSPLPSGVAFLLGVAAAAAVAELATIAILKGLGSSLNLHDRPIFVGTVNIILGVVTVWFSVRLLHRPDATDSQLLIEEEHVPTNPRKLFILGFTLMIANVRAVATIGAAINEIYAADVVIVTLLIAIVLLTAVVVLLPAVPIVIYYFAPETAARIPILKERIVANTSGVLNPIARAGSWSWQRARPVAAIATGLIGLWLIGRGVDRIVERFY